MNKNNENNPKSKHDDILKTLSNGGVWSVNQIRKKLLSQNPQIKKVVCEFAEKIGELLAERGVIVFTGGMDGVMELASKGAKNKNGIYLDWSGQWVYQGNQEALLHQHQQPLSLIFCPLQFQYLL